MDSVKEIRVAWIYPSLVFGAYWQPVMREFVKSFKDTIFFTGCLWPGYSSDSPGASIFKIIGKTKFIQTTKTDSGYSRGFISASPKIIFALFRFKPDVIFASAFSIWTALALLFKPLGKWKIVIIYDGSSPNTEFRDSKIRILVRRLISRFTDAFVANSSAAANYLIRVLDIPSTKVYQETYLVPDQKTLLGRANHSENLYPTLKHPIFLFIGQIITRKGIKTLLQACCLLQQWGHKDFSLVIIGDGVQREELEAFVSENDLTEQVLWLGWINYDQLGHYLDFSDIFIFPTLEDVWGMAVLEAMAFGKPILCSKGANASEMVVDGENGFLFDPHDSEQLAMQMLKVLKSPELVPLMGNKSKQMMSQYTPQTAARSFARIIERVKS